MKGLRLASALAGALVLAACGSGDQEEVRQWMREQRAQTKPRIQPIPAPTHFTPQAYQAESPTDPFSPQKLTQALRAETQQGRTPSAALVAPELERRKEPLESFPLDTMSMVGSLVKDGKPVALVKVENLLYQVRPGNYLGQNYGRITRVSENEIVLREIVQDAAGEWVERTATLQLQERSK